MASRSSSLVKVFLFVCVLALGIFGYVNYSKRLQLANEVKKLVQINQDQSSNTSEKQNAEAAKQIIEKVRLLFAMPKDTDPTVAQIVDVNALKARNNFYANAKNGDYLVVTATRAILYDPKQNIILDVVPVQLEQAPAGEQAKSQSASVAPSLKAPTQ